ncbi:hypothetical protein Aau02nite_81010 [Amorphoplanes auranticolor]|uniref:Uncharacterized protein n=1 Tax=Actinoplanes auranticolor TaxID=47988 RepID=A0A919SWP1_9ACTN|nr:hypothetical protein Aau02nite_81010 [Actinoplanes auranticolor]
MYAHVRAVERKWRAGRAAPWSTFRHAAHPGTKFPRIRALGKARLPLGTLPGRKVEEKVERT